jgi:hypothetical protein
VFGWIDLADKAKVLFGRLAGLVGKPEVPHHSTRSMTISHAEATTFIGRHLPTSIIIAAWAGSTRWRNWLRHAGAALSRRSSSHDGEQENDVWARKATIALLWCLDQKKSLEHHSCSVAFPKLATAYP